MAVYYLNIESKQANDHLKMSDSEFLNFKSKISSDIMQLLNEALHFYQIQTKVFSYEDTIISELIFDFNPSSKKFHILK